MLAGAFLTAVVVVSSIPGKPFLELRRRRVAGMVLGDAGLVLLAVGLAPRLARWLPAAAAIDARRLAAVLGLAVLGLGALMVALSAAWPDYAHQLLTREWGLVEPLQFVLYLVAARLCFAMAQDRKSTRLNSSHLVISYAVFCLTKK